MLDRIKEGFFFGIGLFLFISLIFGIVFAVGFHSADEILGGTFTGNFVFQDNVTFNGDVQGISSTSKLENLTITCNSTNEGYLKYNNSNPNVQFCNGDEWKSLEIATTYSNDIYNILLLHFDNDYTDYSIKGQTVLETGNINFVNGKFGQAAYFNPNSTNYIEADSSDFDFGSGDFTIDYWIKVDGAVSGYLLGNKWPGGSGNDKWGTYAWFSAGSMRWGYCSRTTCGNVAGSTLINDSNWHHIAYVKNGGNHMIFIDGNLEASGAVPGASVNFLSNIFSVGNQYPDPIFTGYIDEFRVSKGIARWTSSFTPPSTPYS